MQVSVGCLYQSEAANIELSVLVQERLLYVLLNDIAAPVPVDLLSLNQTLDVVEITADLDTAASVRILTRLHDPKGGTVLGEFL